MNLICLIKVNNEYYIFSGDSNFGNCEPIKIFNLNGNKIKVINDSNYSTNNIDIFYVNNLNTNFIIILNDKCCRSYDFDKIEIYHKYYDNDNKSHYSIIMNYKN